MNTRQLSKVIFTDPGICPICLKEGLIRLDTFELRAVKIHPEIVHENESFVHIRIGKKEAIVKLVPDEIAA